MKLPLVDVVIITYNQEEFIVETIESILSQSYNNIRIIIADDGSTDNTQKIIESYAHRYSNMIPILSKKNTGIASNFNRALRQISGQYVAWLGGDDLMLPQKIETQVDLLESHPEFSGCYTDAEVFEYPSGNVLGRFSEIFAGGSIEEVVDIKKFLNPKTQLLPSTFMIRSKFIPTWGFDERFKILNDFIFDAEIILNAPFKGIPEILTRYRRHKKNVGKNKSLCKILFEENLMALALLEARYPFLARHLKKRKNYYLLLEAIKTIPKNKKLANNLIKNAFMDGDKLRAIGCYLFGHFFYKYLQNESNKKYLSKIRKLIYK